MLFFILEERKNMKKKIVSILCVAAMVSMAISGCGGDKEKKDDSAKKQDGIKAYVGTTLFEGSLDPVKGALPHGYPFINNALLKVDSNSKYVGDLAKSWEVSQDALTYTFHLNEDIKSVYQ